MSAIPGIMMTAAVVDMGKVLTGTESLLDSLDIELTERCNFSCQHCYIRKPAADKDAISREAGTQWWLELLTDAAHLGCHSIRFTGGEPLFREDFLAIYLHARSLGLKISIATNASLLRADIAQSFGETPKPDINVSLYGWDSASYHRTTGVASSFEDFLAGVNLLKQHDVEFGLRYPPLYQFTKRRKQISAFAKKIGARLPLSYPWELILNAWNDQAACSRIRALRLSPALAAKERIKDPVVAAEDLRKLLNSDEKPSAKRVFGCAAASKRPTINAYGQLQVCLQVRHPQTLYDLRQSSLSAGLKEHFPKVRRFVVKDPVFKERCATCLLKAACPQCPACSWTEYGNLDSPVGYYCEVMHEEARILGVLGRKEKGWKVQSLRKPHSSLARRIRLLF